MDDPSWAAGTVWIVAQPERGMALSKAWFRVLGTLTGTCFALVLSALCIQVPELFLAGLALWIGLCTALATLTRNFRAYAMVLAGYTAVLVALGAASQPEHVFEIAISRFIYVCLGILCETVVTSVLAPGRAQQALDQRIRTAVAHVAQATGRALRGRLAPGAEMQRLVGEINGLETAAEYAAAQSRDVRRHQGHVRQVMSNLLIELSAAHSASRRIARTPLFALTHRVAAARLAEARSLFDDVPPALAAGRERAMTERVQALRQALAIEMALPGEGRDGPSRQSRFVLDRLDIMLRSLEQSLTNLIGLAAPPHGHGRAEHHRDWRAAGINGTRAAIAVGLASWFWIVSAWPEGSTFVVIVAVVCALFATQNNPSAGSIAFLKGTALATVPAFFANFVILPQMSGFPMLALGIAPVLFVAGLGYFTRQAGMAAACAIFFWNMIAPENLTRQTASGYFNTAVTLLFAMAMAALVFNLILPPNPAGARQRLLRAILHDLGQPLRGQASSTHAWARRMADRIAQVGALATREEQASPRLFAQMLAVLDLGLAAARLKRVSQETDLPQAGVDAISRVLARLRQVERAPVATIHAVRSMQGSLTRLLPTLAPLQALPVARALELGREIAERIEEHPELFRERRRRGRASRSGQRDAQFRRQPVQG